MKTQLICGTGLMMSSLACGQQIDWLEERLGALGSGCAPGEVMVSSYGNELDIAFMNFNVFLDPSTGTRTQNKQCRITVPAFVKSGLYLAALNERLDYGITKTYGTTASLDSRAWFFGWPIQKRSVTFLRGVISPGDSRSSSSIQRNSAWVVRDEFCNRPDGIQGLYVNQMNMLGARDNPSESLSFGTGGLNVKWHVLAVAYFCR